MDEYELVDVPIEQHSDSTQDNFGVGMATISDTNSMSGLAPRMGSSTELCHGVDPCQRSSLSSPQLCCYRCLVFGHISQFHLRQLQSYFLLEVSSELLGNNW